LLRREIHTARGYFPCNTQREEGVAEARERDTQREGIPCTREDRGLLRRERHREGVYPCTKRGC
jgi:hypothetical protein